MVDKVMEGWQTYSFFTEKIVSEYKIQVFRHDREHLRPLDESFLKEKAHRRVALWTGDTFLHTHNFPDPITMEAVEKWSLEWLEVYIQNTLTANRKTLNDIKSLLQPFQPPLDFDRCERTIRALLNSHAYENGTAHPLSSFLSEISSRVGFEWVVAKYLRETDLSSDCDFLRCLAHVEVRESFALSIFVWALGTGQAGIQDAALYALEWWEIPSGWAYLKNCALADPFLQEYATRLLEERATFPWWCKPDPCR